MASAPIPVVDGHNDALLRAWRSGISLRERSCEGHLDLPRMREGGIARADGELDTATPLEVIAGHVEHMAERMGLEHVALGSDFDGCHPPEALADASRTQALLEHLAAHGWSRDELRALAHGNWLRVLRATWAK